MTSPELPRRGTRPDYCVLSKVPPNETPLPDSNKYRQYESRLYREQLEAEFPSGRFVVARAPTWAGPIEYTVIAQWNVGLDRVAQAIQYHAACMALEGRSLVWDETRAAQIQDLRASLERERVAY